MKGRILDISLSHGRATDTLRVAKFMNYLREPIFFEGMIVLVADFRLSSWVTQLAALKQRAQR